MTPCQTGSVDWLDPGDAVTVCKALCLGCPMRRECGRRALADYRWTAGVWAGFDMNHKADRRAFLRWMGQA